MAESSPSSSKSKSNSQYSRLLFPGREFKGTLDPEGDLSAELTKIFGTKRYFRHQPIGNHFVHKLGGIAEHLVVVESSGELVAAAKLAVKFKKPYIVVGGLTGALFSEIGFPALVIVNRCHNLNFSENKSEITVDAGIGNAELANLTASRGLSGLEFLSAIPGTLGGAIVTSASLEGKDLFNLIKELVVFAPDSEEGQIITINQADHLTRENFRSLFREAESSPIILSATLRLSQIDPSEILRRLQGIRKRNSANRAVGQALGYFFDVNLEQLAISRQELKKLQLPKNVTIDWRNPNFLFYRVNKGIQPTDLRSAIEAIQTLLAQQGINREVRLRFLGYWPNKEGNGSSTNAESLPH